MRGQLGSLLLVGLLWLASCGAAWHWRAESLRISRLRSGSLTTGMAARRAALQRERSRLAARGAQEAEEVVRLETALARACAEHGAVVRRNRGLEARIERALRHERVQVRERELKLMANITRCHLLGSIPRLAPRPTRQYASRAELLQCMALQDRPFGEVVFGGSSVVTLDRGRKDGVQPGVAFLVFGRDESGFLQYRARIEPLRIESQYSIARVTHLASRVHWPAGGDKLFNKLLRKPRVAILGKLAVTEKLRRMGARIDERLTHRTELLIVGRGFENDPAYLKATRELNIEVLTVEQLREFIAF